MKDSIKKGIKSIWKKAIVSILEKYYPDKVQLKTIYLEIEDHVTLTDFHRELGKGISEPRYHRMIRAYLRQLKDDGMVENVERGSGYWRCRDC
jgi:DNA integrity scanning protein DisA with diadenylate cyclase activity